MLFFTMRGSYTHPDLPPPIIFIVTSHSPTPVMSSPNSLIPHRGTPASARSATSSNRGVSFTLPSPDALASPPSNNRIAADSIDPSADDHFVRAIARHSVASPQAVLLTPSNERSATSSATTTATNPQQQQQTIRNINSNQFVIATETNTQQQQQQQQQPIRNN